MSDDLTSLSTATDGEGPTKKREEYLLCLVTRARAREGREKKLSLSRRTSPERRREENDYLLAKPSNLISHPNGERRMAVKKKDKVSPSSTDEPMMRPEKASYLFHKQQEGEEKGRDIVSLQIALGGCWSFTDRV